MKKQDFDKKKIAIIAVGVVAVVILASVFIGKPERSVAAFCKVQKEENARLEKANGETYAVKIFSHRTSDPGDFAQAFGNLEKVSPDEIQPDVKTLKQIFGKINQDPSQALGAALSGVGAEQAVKNYIDSNCQSSR